MKKFFLITILTGMLFSCGDDDLLEVDQIASGNKIIGFQDKVANVAYFSDIGQVQNEFAVKLIGLGDGSLPTSDVQLEYEVDLVNSTAIEGVEFEFLDDSRLLTLSAGSTFTTLPINVNTGNLNTSMPTELYINLKPVNGFTVAEFNKQLKIVFVGCSTMLEGTYSYGSTTFDITKIAPNKYRSGYMPAFASVYWFEFTDVCGTLEITDWQFQSSNPITDTNTPTAFPQGYVDGSGNIVFENTNVAGVSWYVDLTWTLIKN